MPFVPFFREGLERSLQPLDLLKKRLEERLVNQYNLPFLSLVIMGNVELALKDGN